MISTNTSRWMLAMLTGTTLAVGGCAESVEDGTSYTVVVSQPGATSAQRIALPPAQPPGARGVVVVPVTGMKITVDTGSSELSIPNHRPDTGDRLYPGPDHGNPGFPQGGAKLPGGDRGLDAFPRQFEQGVVRPEGGLDAVVPPDAPRGDVVAQPQPGASLGLRPGLDAFPLVFADSIEVPEGGLVAVPPGDASGNSALAQPGAIIVRPPSLSVAGRTIEAAVADERFVFVTTSDEPAVRGYDRRTGQTIVITADDDASVPMGVTLDDSYVYWTDLGTGDVLRADLATFTVSRVASGQLAPLSIAVVDGQVSWTNLGDDTVYRE